MYNFLKAVSKKIIPKEILLKNEDLFRKLMLPFYQGSNHECNLCNTKLRSFAILENGEKICPICGSIPRTRRLFMLLETEYLKRNTTFLDFSPLRIMYRKLKKRKDINYFPSDFEDEFLADHHFDITNIETENDKFDLIVCYHILEHIIKDELAMQELYRVLKNEGVLLIQTPFKDGEIYEDHSITSMEEREKKFGQNNHVRIYSVDGLEKRLQYAGFQTEIRTFKKDDHFGLADNERIIICKK